MVDLSINDEPKLVLLLSCELEWKIIYFLCVLCLQKYLHDMQYLLYYGKIYKKTIGLL